METQNLIPVNIVVGDRTYRVKINSDDEEHIRKTSRKLNDQVTDFKTQYAGKDMQDYLAMVLLSLVTQQQTLPLSAKLETSTDHLDRIERLIDGVLEE